MKKLVSAGDHPPYMKNAREELDLVLKGSNREKWQYFLNYCLEDEEAEYVFACSGNFKLLEMYDTFYHGRWRPESRRVLCQQAFFARRFEYISDEMAKKRFRAWQYHLLAASPMSFVSEKVYGEWADRLLCQGENMIPELTPEEQRDLLESRYLPDIRDYGRCREWTGDNRVRFIKLGDLYALFLYLQLFRFETVEEELALLQLGYGPLMWKYALEHYLSEPACAAIFLSDNKPLWESVYWLNYVFNKPAADKEKIEADLERRYGCIFRD